MKASKGIGVRVIQVRGHKRIAQPKSGRQEQVGKMVVLDRTAQARQGLSFTCTERVRWSYKALDIKMLLRRVLLDTAYTLCMLQYKKKRLHK